MLSQPQVSFLREKIMTLEQALFFNFSEAVLRLPTSIINALHVDELGQVWFAIRRPTQNISEFDREFLSRLDFYKKGVDFYLHLTGKACMVIDPEQITALYDTIPDLKHKLADNTVLLKLHVSEVYYYQVPAAAPKARSESPKTGLQPSALVKTLQYIVKDIIPVFQSH